MIIIIKDYPKKRRKKQKKGNIEKYHQGQTYFFKYHSWLDILGIPSINIYLLATYSVLHTFEFTIALSFLGFFFSSLLCHTKRKPNSLSQPQIWFYLSRLTTITLPLSSLRPPPLYLSALCDHHQSLSQLRDHHQIRYQTCFGSRLHIPSNKRRTHHLLPQAQGVSIYRL